MEQPANLPARAAAVVPARSAPPALEYRLEPLIAPWLLGALLLGAAVVAWRANAANARGLAFAPRLLLGILRCGALLALGFCLVRPVCVTRGRLEEKAQAFMALDASASMNFRDESGGRTRWETATNIVEKNRPRIAALERQLEVKRFAFDSEARAVERLPGEDKASLAEPRGGSTNFGALFERLLAAGAGVPTTGVLLFSDGRHNAPSDIIPAAMALGRANIPLYIVGLGYDAPPADYRDIRIKRLVLPEKAFVGGRMRIGVEIESTLPSRQAVPLKVEVNGRTIYAGRVDLPAGANIPAPLVEIPFTPEALGVHRVTASLAALPGEANLANNTAVAFFRAFRSRIGVWYVEGSVRKEFGAIRSALETAPNVQLRAMNAFMARSSASDELLPSAEEWQGIKLVIIGDLPASRFTREGLQRLEKFVQDGGSVLMLGGFSTFGAGNWQHSPLYPALPVEMAARDGSIDGPLPMKFGEDETHPILKIAASPEQSRALWALLPPVPGLNRVAGTRPLARTLLRAGPWNLLVVQEYGRGRSAVFTSDMTWQWIIKAGQPEAHKAFWRNLVTWLTRSDYHDTNKAIFADADRLHYLKGEDGIFGIHVHTAEKFAPQIPTARVTGTLARIGDSGETVLFQEVFGKGAGDFSRRLTFSQPGAYRFKAALLAPGGAVLDTDSLDVFVTAPDLENDNPRANLRLLRRIALLSGGMYFDPENADKAFAALLKPGAGYVKETLDVKELWNTPLVLALFVALLSVEWFVRRRLGLA